MVHIEKRYYQQVRDYFIWTLHRSSSITNKSWARDLVLKPDFKIFKIFVNVTSRVQIFTSFYLLLLLLVLDTQHNIAIPPLSPLQK